MSQAGLTISQVAREAGVGIETLRYYQRIGLLEEPAKPASGYRRYPPAILDTLNFIQRAKQLGFTLTEIKELLALDASACTQTRALARQKLALIQQKITALQAMSVELEQLIEACEHDAEHKGCPIIKTLAGD